jgi:hypothetical protein
MGDIMAAARRSAAGVEGWLRKTDRGLATRLAGAAAAEGESVAAFVRIAVADFSRHASEDDWATLLSRLRDDPEPGTTCLVTMLRWRLDAAEAQPATPAPVEGPTR